VVTALDDEVEQLRRFLSLPQLREHELQKFFEEHPDLLLGTEHRRLHSQLVMTREDGSQLRPDFFLERIDGCLSDIVDLKLPTARLVVGEKNRRRFGSSLSSVVGQLGTYRSYFDEANNRKKFYDRYGLQVYKPMVFAVIGRSGDFKNSMEREEVQQSLSQVKIVTYDDILLRSKRRREMILSAFR
jgi:hypothetical protein